MKSKLLITSLAIITFLNSTNEVIASENDTLNGVTEEGEVSELLIHTDKVVENSIIKKLNGEIDDLYDQELQDLDLEEPEVEEGEQENLEPKKQELEVLDLEDLELEDVEQENSELEDLVQPELQDEEQDEKEFPNRPSEPNNKLNMEAEQGNEEDIGNELKQQELNEKSSEINQPAIETTNGNSIKTEGKLKLSQQNLAMMETTPVEFDLIIKNQGFTIDTLPWGEEGYEYTGKNSDEFINEAVQVRSVSDGGTYMQIFSNGEFLGWIDYRSFTNPTGKKAGMIVREGYTVDTKPWETGGYQTISHTDDYLGSNVTILTPNSTNNYYFALKNNLALGWIDYRAFATDLSKEKNYIIYPDYSIDGRPWSETKVGTFNNGSTSQHLNKTVYIYDTVDNDSYYFVKDTNGETLGWIDYRAFSNSAEYQTAMITRNKYSIDDKPWGTTGFQTIGSTGDKLGDPVTLIATNTTNNYYFVIDSSDNVLGWIDNKALSKKLIHEENIIIGENFSIDGKPWSEKGSEPLDKGTTTSYLYQDIVIYDKADNDSYFFVKKINGETLGWIDYRAFIDFANTKDAIVIRDGYSIDSLPWGTPGYEMKDSTDNNFGDFVNVVASDDTNNYYLVTKNGTVLGWMDYRSITFNSPLDTNHILFPDYTIDGRPWVEAGTQTLVNGTTSNFLNKEVSIYEVADNGSYYFIKAKDDSISGWVDHRSLGNKNGDRKQLRKKNYSIDSLPWGTSGFRTLGMSDYYIGKEAVILGESKNGLYSAILVDNSYLGWTDNRVFDAWLIYLDVGHGGADPGTVNFGYNEKDLNLNISFKLRNKLVAEGYDVVISRTDDSTVGLFDRPKEANQLGADIFVSIHHNNVPNAQVHGIETIYYGPSSSFPPLRENLPYHNNPERIAESKSLAESIHYELIKNTGANDRRGKPFSGAYVVVRETHMPAVLLELGFMSNRAELDKLLNENYQNILVNSIVSGIKSFSN